MAWYNNGTERTTIIMVDVFSQYTVTQKVPHTGVDLEVYEEQWRVGVRVRVRVRVVQGSKREVGGNPSQCTCQSYCTSDTRFIQYLS